MIRLIGIAFIACLLLSPAWAETSPEEWAQAAQDIATAPNLTETQKQELYGVLLRLQRIEQNTEALQQLNQAPAYIPRRHYPQQPLNCEVRQRGAYTADMQCW